MELKLEETDGDREHDILRTVLAGDREQFRLIVRAYQERVFACIMRQVGNDDLAQELAQETFIRAYRHLATFRGEARFSTWLLHIATNTASSYFASKAYRQQANTIPLDLESHDSPQPIDSFDFDAIQRLRRGVAALSPKLREVLILCSFEQKTYEEVAVLLHIPVGTVRSRLHAARQSLRKSYFQE